MIFAATDAELLTAEFSPLAGLMNELSDGLRLQRPIVEGNPRNVAARFRDVKIDLSEVAYEQLTTQSGCITAIAAFPMDRPSWRTSPACDKPVA